MDLNIQQSQDIKLKQNKKVRVALLALSSLMLLVTSLVLHDLLIKNDRVEYIMAGDPSLQSFSNGRSIASVGDIKFKTEWEKSIAKKLDQDSMIQKSFISESPSVLDEMISEKFGQSYNYKLKNVDGLRKVASLTFNMQDPQNMKVWNKTVMDELKNISYVKYDQWKVINTSENSKTIKVFFDTKETGTMEFKLNDQRQILSVTISDSL